MDAEALDRAAKLALVFDIAMWLFATIVGLWILWAIIRGAVLSALRKHSEEQSGARSTPVEPPPSRG